jgi:lipoyl(octanoyl) transferase
MAVLELGVTPYRQAWDLQKRLAEERHHERIDDVVIMLEHPPVYTLGRRARPEHVLLDAVALQARGIEVVEVDRGGDVTYHGPGQLVVYPVLRLVRARHVVDFVRSLEDVAITALDAFGIRGTRREGMTGVWVEREKLVAIGVRVGAGGVTSHGLALNVAPDLADFTGIVPCGITTEGVCSLASLGVDASMTQVQRALRDALATVYRADIQDVPVAGHLSEVVRSQTRIAAPTGALVGTISTQNDGTARS